MGKRRNVRRDGRLASNYVEGAAEPESAWVRATLNDLFVVGYIPALTLAIPSCFFCTMTYVATSQRGDTVLLLAQVSAPFPHWNESKGDRRFTLEKMTSSPLSILGCPDLPFQPRPEVMNPKPPVSRHEPYPIAFVMRHYAEPFLLLLVVGLRGSATS